MKCYSSIEWMMINIANHYGLDKEIYSKRLEFVEENEDCLESLIVQAEEPELYWKAVNAYRQAQKGKAIGTPVFLDACSSGFQVLSAVTGCKKGCIASGLINHEEETRPNAYRDIQHKMEELLGNKININYKDIKKAAMTAAYGSTKVPKEKFDTPDLLEAFYKAAEEVMPNVFKLLPLLINSWQPYVKKHCWIMPDSYYVHIPVLDKIVETITIPELNNWEMKIITTQNIGLAKSKALAANITHSIDAYVLRSLIRYCTYDKENIIIKKAMLEKELAKRTDSAEVIFTDITKLNEDFSYLLTGELMSLYIDVDNMLQHEPFEIMTIHDCFGVHPNNVNVLRYWYNNIMSKLSTSNILNDILSQIYGTEVEVDLPREDIAEEILQSDYAIC